MEAIIFEKNTSYKVPTGVGSVEYKVLDKKGSVKKKSIKRSRLFQKALEGGNNRNVAWEKFDNLGFLSCSRKHSVNID